MPALDPKAIGKRLEALRESRGLSQRGLAKEIKLAQSAISDYEQGKRLPTTQAMEKILAFFNVPAAELMSPAAGTPEESKRQFILRKLYERLDVMSIDGLMALSMVIDRLSQFERGQRTE